MDDSLRSVGLLLFALFLVLLNGFFVAAEFALVKVRATRVEELAAKNRFGAKKAQHAVQHLDSYLSATQLGITLASLGLGYIGEPAFARLLEPAFAGFPPATRHALAFAIAFTIITALHIVVGELAPKSLAIQKAEATTLAVVYPLDWFYRLFRLPIFLLNGIAGLVLRLFGLRPASGEGDGEAHSEAELRLILDASHAGGEIKESELKLVHQIFDFAHRQAKEIMIPRPDIVYLSTDRSIPDNIAVTEEAGFTRYPLCNGSADEVLGMIHVKDLLALGGRATDLTPEGAAARLREIARPVLRVPETKPIDQMLREFQRQHQHLAIVVDEYGGTAGMVTLEDILEEIVGDIQDEFDRTAPELEPAGKDCYHVDARMSLAKLERTLGFAGPEEAPDVDTVGGFALSMLGAAARVGDTLAYGDATVTITEMAGRRVRKVRVCVPEPGGGEGATPGEADAALAPAAGSHAETAAAGAPTVNERP
jgi:CBS domain containing-hemolysin-like protein